MFDEYSSDSRVQPPTITLDAHFGIKIWKRRDQS